LYLVVQPSGAKSWALRYRFGGRPAKLTLGTLLVIDRDGKEPDKPDIGGPLTLAAARKLAGDALLQVRQGRDPGAQKKAQRVATALVAADTLRLICEEYLKREGPRLRTVGQRRAIFDRLIYPVLGQRQIDSIKRSDVARLLDEVEDKSGARMADMTLAVLRRVMNWHASRSDDFRSPIVRGMARTKPKERARERTLTDDELRAIWKVAADFEGPFGALLRLLLLTGARRSEAASLRWSELAGTDWILPAARNKTKVDLLRPLSSSALALLEKVQKIADCDFVFTTDGKRPIGGFSKFKVEIDKVCGVTGWTLHDLRRTARSLMSRAGVPTDHAERCLGHVITGVRATYDRHEFRAEKKRAFEALATQIELVLNPQHNVAPLHLSGRRASLPR
jgi:integrase